MLYTEKIRIYPNKLQRHLINQTLKTCQYLYNQLLSYSKEYYQNKIREKKYLSKFDYNKLIKNYINTKDTNVYVQVLQATCGRLSDAYDRFFKKQNRYPKFKSIRQFKSFTYPQSTGFALLPTNKIRLGKFGKVKAKF